jgi:hypothetical protein
MMKRIIVVAWAIALLALSACNRATPALPAPAAPNVEWAPLQAAAELEVKALDPAAVLLQATATEIDLSSNDVSQRVEFRYITPDFIAVDVSVRQEKGVIGITWSHTRTLNLPVETSLRGLADTESPFPTTPDELRDYQRRAAQVRLSPREALIKAFAKEQTRTPNQCDLIKVSLIFPPASDPPEWSILLVCRPTVTLMFSIDAATGQLIDRTEVK